MGFHVMGRIRTKDPLFFGFSSARENIGVMSGNEMAIYLEDGVHVNKYVYTPEGMKSGRNQSNGGSSGG